MASGSSANVGPAMQYDSQWNGPLGVERKPTNFPFVIAFDFCFVAWIIFGICVFTASRLGGDKLQTQTADNVGDFEEVSFSSVVGTVLLSTLVAIIGTALYLLLLKYITLTFAVVALISLELIMIAGIIVQTTMEDKLGVFTEEPEIDMRSVKLIACAILLTIVITPLICVIVHWKSFRIACEVIKEATKAIFNLPKLYLFRILQCSLQGLAIIFGTIIFTSIVELESREKGGGSDLLTFLHFFNLCGFAWTMDYIYGFARLVYSGTFSTWYWSTDKAQVKSDVILKFTNTSAKFHAGAAACGSLAIATMKLLGQAYDYRTDGMTYLVEYTDIGHLLLFSGFFVFLMGLVNKFVYVMCIVHGTGFLQSAKDAKNLIRRHKMKLFILLFVWFVIQMVGIGLIILTAGILVLPISSDEDGTDTNLLSNMAVFPAFIAVIISIGILDAAIFTIFLSVLEDYDRNDGSSQRSDFMSDTLKALLTPN